MWLVRFHWGIVQDPPCRESGPSLHIGNLSLDSPSTSRAATVVLPSSVFVSSQHWGHKGGSGYRLALNALRAGEKGRRK